MNVKNKKKRISISKILGLLCSIPKTIYFNLRAFPLAIALKLPVLVYYKVRIVEIHKNIIQFPNGFHPLMVRIGYGGGRSIIGHNYSIINIRKGHVRFLGSANFAEGTVLDNCGELTFGHHFSTNKNPFISCSKEITFGDDVMFGYNVSVRDSDGHTVYLDGEPKTSQRPIIVGNHAWLASHSHVLKGAVIPDDSIVAFGCVTSSKFSDKGSLIVGVPGKQTQKGVSWGVFIQ